MEPVVEPVVEPVAPRPAAPRPVAAEPAAAARSSAPVRERLGGLTRRQWAAAAVVAGFALFGFFAAVVLGARAIAGTDVVERFLLRYPGEYHLPAWAPVGLPAWLGWQHFFNGLLILLIIRSGLQVRTERRAPAMWASRRQPGRKVSLTIWAHQALDVLWLLNGLMFAVLLFATGQWVRIVPTSWEVFPNALSAALQYATLDWPSENGWVNYNSLQQLAYFLTVFVAAPLAAVTGVRMSSVWPARWTGLSRRYPVGVARALHLPTMLYFVGFIVVHVGLVLATGALRNLNHVYAAQDGPGWAGFWFFAASLLVVAGAWVAFRPALLAPVARLFGTVTRS
ncbi:cytochrome b/b6 domain-containing protein [Kineococcus sp. SYSU DK001]|uniref:cytochrome b/b6 domain-containing protein n=1 Tax=Kineococcus sp. SYSU DK001 TaxID=3383122 RepID=UPI003D7CCEA2